MQETLLKALRAYPRLRHGNHLRAWLYRVATTTVYDHGSARRKETPVESVPEQAADPEHVDHAFEELTERLTPSARTALTLRFVDDLTYEDIAARLDCSPAAARQRVSTAVRRLREVL
jgi:RNA polymerase sigma-70 factor (ECF subfamily)